jgi:hypothetical protein
MPDHRRPGVLRQLVRCIVADPVGLPALDLGVKPSAVSRDFANLANGPVRVSLPTAGENELFVHELGQGPPASSAHSLAVRHQGDRAGHMRFAELVTTSEDVQNH